VEECKPLAAGVLAGGCSHFRVCHKVGRCNLKPLQSRVQTACSHRLKRLKRKDKRQLVSSFAFKVNLRRYNKVSEVVPPAVNWVSADRYWSSPPHKPGAHAAALKGIYEERIFPRLLPHQRALLVPGQGGSREQALDRR
jgi:hypothetical protein